MFEYYQVGVIVLLYAAAVGVAALPVRSLSRLPPLSGRYIHLDGLRGLAAVGVVSCHINQHVMFALGFGGLTPEIGDHLGIVCVQMFFALSAFLFTSRLLSAKLDFALFYVGRVRRIVPLYLVAVVMSIATAALWTTVPIFTTEALIEVLNIFKFGFVALLPIPPLPLLGLNGHALIGVAWTLTYEWIFYLLLVPLYLLGRTSTAGAIAVLSITAGLAIRDYAASLEMVVWVFFLPGVAAALLKQIAPPFPPAVKHLLAVSSALLMLAILALPGYWTPIKLLLVAAMFLCLLFCETRALTVAPLLTLGRISFSIYLLQYIVLFNFLQLAYRLAATGSMTQMGVLIAIMPTLIFAAMITYRYIERPGVELGTVRRKCLTPTSGNQQAGASAIGLGTRG